LPGFGGRDEAGGGERLGGVVEVKAMREGV
jgi:hypothetical protein